MNISNKKWKNMNIKQDARTDITLLEVCLKKYFPITQVIHSDKSISN